MGICWGCPQYFKKFIMAEFTGYDTGQRTRLSKRVESNQAPPILQDPAKVGPPTPTQGVNTPTGKVVDRSGSQAWEATRAGVATAVPIAAPFHAAAKTAESAGAPKSLIDPAGRQIQLIEEKDNEGLAYQTLGGPIGGFIYDKKKG